MDSIPSRGLESGVDLNPLTGDRILQITDLFPEFGYRTGRCSVVKFQFRCSNPDSDNDRVWRSVYFGHLSTTVRESENTVNL